MIYITYLNSPFHYSLLPTFAFQPGYRIPEAVRKAASDTELLVHSAGYTTHRLYLFSDLWRIREGLLP